jgi:hypothetical protein
MAPHEQSPSVRVGTGPDGSLTYQVSMPPEVLPPVRGRDLEQAWYAARNAALDQRWGVVRGFRFARPDGSHTELALADRDACCWVAGVDLAFGIGNAHGLSVCLRLLALIDLLAHASWARPMLHIARDGAEMHPALLRIAAIHPLTEHGRFDETGFRTRLSRHVLGARIESTDAASRLPGATRP